MTIFKTQLSENDFIKLVYQLGFARYSCLCEKFKKINYQESLLFIIVETITSSFVKCALKNKNTTIDIVNEVDKLVDSAFQNEEDKCNHIQYFIYIRDEIWELISINDIKLVYRLVDYFTEEMNITLSEEYPNLKQYLVDEFTRWYYESKKLINSIRLK